jgi:hypothetical protein
MITDTYASLLTAWRDLLSRLGGSRREHRELFSALMAKISHLEAKQKQQGVLIRKREEENARLKEELCAVSASMPSQVLQAQHNEVLNEILNGSSKGGGIGDLDPTLRMSIESAHEGFERWGVSYVHS